MLVYCSCIFNQIILKLKYLKFIKKYVWVYYKIKNSEYCQQSTYCIKNTNKCHLKANYTKLIYNLKLMSWSYRQSNVVSGFMFVQQIIPPFDGREIPPQCVIHLPLYAAQYNPFTFSQMTLYDSPVYLALLRLSLSH